MSNCDEDISTEPPPLSWLYVRGDQPDRMNRAVASGADVVVIDWEDAVAPEAKAEARRQTMAWLEQRPTRDSSGWPLIEIRVNGSGSEWQRDDLTTIGDNPAVDSIRMPKVETAWDVAAVVQRLPSVRIGIHCLLESARGIEHAYEIASAARVTRIGLGETDLAGDLGSSDHAALDWCRARVVVAALAAGLPRPAMSVFTRVSDPDGLADACRHARSLGLLGGNAIHPGQLPIIVESFAPSHAEYAEAQQVLEALAAGTTTLPDGRFIDAASGAHARAVLSTYRPTHPN